MDTPIDPSKNPFLVLKNVFGSKDSNNIPIIDIISFAAYGEDIIGSPGYSDGNFSEENVCVIVKYKNRTSYYRLDWRWSEGLEGYRFHGPFEEWISKYLGIDPLKPGLEKAKKVRLNREIQDIFLQNRDPKRMWCNFTPCMLADRLALLFQFFDQPINRAFLYTLLKWNPTQEKSGFEEENCRHIDEIFKKYPILKDFISIEPYYYSNYREKEISYNEKVKSVEEGEEEEEEI